MSAPRKRRYSDTDLSGKNVEFVFYPNFIKESNVSPFDMLPNECLAKILSSPVIGIPQRLPLETVCRRWHDVLMESYWNVEREFVLYGFLDWDKFSKECGIFCE